MVTPLLLQLPSALVLQPQVCNINVCVNLTRLCLRSLCMPCQLDLDRRTNIWQHEICTCGGSLDPVAPKVRSSGAGVRMCEADVLDTHIHMSWVRRVHHPFRKSSWNSLPLPSVLRLLEMVLPVTLQLLAASHGSCMFFFDIHVSCDVLAQASEPWSGSMHEIYRCCNWEYRFQCLQKKSLRASLACVHS